MDVTYRYFDGPEQEQQARDAFERVRSVLPFWVASVTVDRLDGDDSMSVSAIWCSPEYRGIRIALYHGFFEQSRRDRERTMLHECIHAFSARVSDWTRDLINDTWEKDNPTAHRMLVDALRERSESMTEDLTYAFVTALGLEN